MLAALPININVKVTVVLAWLKFFEDSTSNVLEISCYVRAYHWIVVVMLNNAVF